MRTTFVAASIADGQAGAHWLGCFVRWLGSRCAHLAEVKRFNFAVLCLSFTFANVCLAAVLESVLNAILTFGPVGPFVGQDGVTQAAAAARCGWRVSVDHAHAGIFRCKRGRLSFSGFRI